MDRPSLALPPALAAALDRALIAGTPAGLPHLALWAARQVPLRTPWTDLVALAQEAAEGRATTEALAALHRQRSGAACAATVSGLSRGLAAAAADLAAFHTAHPDPRRAARGAVESIYHWHVLSPEGDAAAFAARAAALAEPLSGMHRN